MSAPKVKSGQQSKSAKTLVPEKSEAFAMGDFDHDGKQDTAWVATSAHYTTPRADVPDRPEFAGCVNKDCHNTIRFSNRFPEIRIDNSLWGSVEEIDDLDEDGIDEFIFQTNWWIGSHVSIYIYSFDVSSWGWKVLAHNNLYFKDSYKDRIEKLSKKEFRFQIEYFDTIQADLTTKDTIIQIHKK